MQATNKKVWALQLTRYFVTKHDYIQVRFINTAPGHASDGDIWLAKKEKAEFIIIHISTNEVEMIDKQAMVDEELKTLKNALHTNGRMLEIELFPMTTYEHDDILHIGLTPGCTLDPRVSQYFPEINTVIFDVEDATKEVRSLSKDIEKYQAKTSAKKTKEQRRVFFAESSMMFKICCVICSILWAAVFLLSKGLEISDISASIMVGSYYKAFITILNEWYRLLTAGFVHISFWHMFCNLMALHSISNILEKELGPKKCWCILLEGIIAGNLTVYIADVNTVAVGLSGGIYALMAAMLVYFWSEGYLEIPSLRAKLFQVLMINLLLNFMPTVSWKAHLGGFVAGLFLGVILNQKIEKSLRTNAIVALVAIVIGCGYLTVQNTRFNDIYYGTDQEVAAGFKKLGMTSTADRIVKECLQYYMEVNWNE